MPFIVPAFLVVVSLIALAVAVADSAQASAHGAIQPKASFTYRAYSA